MKLLKTVLLLVLAWPIANGQTADIVIRNGHVIDPRNNIDRIMDVAIRDKKIVEVSGKITSNASKVIDATGLYVVPGLIDIHGHHFFGTDDHRYLSNSYDAQQPDGFTFRSG